MAKNILCVFLLAVALSGCGGGGSDDRPTFDDTAASTQISRNAVYPISRNYAAAGTYTVTVSGQYAVTSISAGSLDQLAVWFSYSGQGSMTGTEQPTYAISANGQAITVSQAVTVTTAGAGPWQMDVLCFTGGSTGMMTNLTMHSVLN